jgi:hypothetical protein
MADKPQSLKEVVESAQTKLKSELEAAANTFAEFSVIGLKHIMTHPMFENTLKTLGLQVISEAPPKAAKPGRKPGRKPGATPPPPQAPEEDKKALLAAMKAIGGQMRSGAAYKKAKMDKAQGKKTMAALKADGAVKMSGPWVSLA